MSCDECRDREERPARLGPVPVVDLPLGATEDRVVGTLDLERARRFYTKVFGWDTTEADTGDAPPYLMFTQDGKVVAGVSELEDQLKEQGIDMEVELQVKKTGCHGFHDNSRKMMRRPARITWTRRKRSRSSASATRSWSVPRIAARGTFTTPSVSRPRICASTKRPTR